MSELHKVGVVPSNQVAAMAETLLAHGDDRSFEGLCRLLSFTGLKLTRTHEVCIIYLIRTVRYWMHVPLYLKYKFENTI